MMLAPIGENLGESFAFMDWKRLSLDFFGVQAEIATADHDCVELLSGNFSFFQTNEKTPILKYGVTRSKQGLKIARSTGRALQATDDGDFLFQVEKEITIEIQKHRSDLYFLHAAALDYKGLGLILVASSGGGKSTTAWALCHHGFRYLSDELAPIDLHSLEIHPYAHALSLKRAPTSPYLLPDATLRTCRTLHVPVCALPGECSNSATRLAAVFFISYRPGPEPPNAVPISRAEAATRLFVNALNPLAHPGYGLDGVMEIVARCSSFDLVTNDLAQTCAVVKKTMEHLRKPSR